jgi:hypothetical protein
MGVAHRVVFVFWQTSDYLYGLTSVNPRRCTSPLNGHIFCKSSSDSSRSVEHIIPESLGNTKQILPREVVCDKCNNYFARKVEKPFLDSSGITELRSFQFIPNKKGNIPFTVGYMNGKHPVQVSPQGEGDIKAFVRVETEVFNKIINEKNGFLILRKDSGRP